MAVVLCHVGFQLLGIGSWRWLPSGLLLGIVEIVGEVLRVRVADFPSGWETGFSLLVLSARSNNQRGS